jgi:hypothetical protein
MDLHRQLIRRSARRRRPKRRRPSRRRPSRRRPSPLRRKISNPLRSNPLNNRLSLPTHLPPMSRTAGKYYLFFEMLYRNLSTSWAEPPEETQIIQTEEGTQQNQHH